MAMKMTGWDDIQATLEGLGDVGNKISTTAFKKSLNDGLNIVKRHAPKDSGHGADCLKVGKVKRYRSGSIWGGIGIDKDNWKDTKHLYYQHYGYEHYKSGERVQPHTGWMDEAHKASEEVVLGTLEKTVLSEIDKILK